jgi:hypothetical protein
MIWKGAILICSRYYTDIFLEALRNVITYLKEESDPVLKHVTDVFVFHLSR